jgi:hypothetical protein
MTSCTCRVTHVKNEVCVVKEATKPSIPHGKVEVIIHSGFYSRHHDWVNLYEMSECLSLCKRRPWIWFVCLHLTENRVPHQEQRYSHLRACKFTIYRIYFMFLFCLPNTTQNTKDFEQKQTQLKIKSSSIQVFIVAIMTGLTCMKCQNVCHCVKEDHGYDS